MHNQVEQLINVSSLSLSLSHVFALSCTLSSSCHKASSYRTPSAGSKCTPGYSNAVPARVQPGMETSLVRWGPRLKWTKL